MERGNLFLDDKGETQVGGPHKCESTEAGKRGGPLRMSEEVSVMEMEQREWVIQLYLKINQSIGRNL